MNTNATVCLKHNQDYLYMGMSLENYPLYILCNDCLIDQKETISNYQLRLISDYLKDLKDQINTAINGAIENSKIIGQIKDFLQKNLDPSMSSFEKNLNTYSLQIDLLQKQLSETNINIQNWRQIENTIQNLEIQYVSLKNHFYIHFQNHNCSYEILKDAIKLMIDRELENQKIFPAKLIYQYEQIFIEHQIQTACYLNNYILLGRNNEIIMLQWESFLQNYVIRQTLIAHETKILKLVNKNQYVISQGQDKKLILWKYTKDGLLELIKKYCECSFFQSDVKICIIQQTLPYKNGLLEVFDTNMAITQQINFDVYIKIAASNKKLTLALFYYIQCWNPANGWILECIKNNVMDVFDILFLKENWISILHKTQIGIYQYRYDLKCFLHSHFINLDAYMNDIPQIMFVEQLNIFICNNQKNIKIVHLKKDQFEVLNNQYIYAVNLKQNKETAKYQLLASYQEVLNKIVVYQWIL